MAEYIAKELLPKKKEYWDDDFGAGFDSCLDEIEKLPNADVQPVKHGEWHGSGDGYADGRLVLDEWECSCCGTYFDEWDEKPTWNFCPNCGADMRGGEQNG